MKKVKRDCVARHVTGAGVKKKSKSRMKKAMKSRIKAEKRPSVQLEALFGRLSYIMAADVSL